MGKHHYSGPYPLVKQLSHVRITRTTIRRNGLIILDNSSWCPRTTRYLRQKGFLQVDFHGFYPIVDVTGTTSFFFSPGWTVNFKRPRNQIHSLAGPRVFCLGANITIDIDLGCQTDIVSVDDILEEPPSEVDTSEITFDAEEEGTWSNPDGTGMTLVGQGYCDFPAGLFTSRHRIREALDTSVEFGKVALFPGRLLISEEEKRFWNRTVRLSLYCAKHGDAQEHDFAVFVTDGSHHVIHSRNFRTGDSVDPFPTRQFRWDSTDFILPGLVQAYHIFICGDIDGLGRGILVDSIRIAPVYPYTQSLDADLRAERDAAVAQRDAALAERDLLLKSRSWKLTKPLRLISRTLRGIRGTR